MGTLGKLLTRPPVPDARARARLGVEILHASRFPEEITIGALGKRASESCGNQTEAISCPKSYLKDAGAPSICIGSFRPFRGLRDIACVTPTTFFQGVLKGQYVLR